MILSLLRNSLFSLTVIIVVITLSALAVLVTTPSPSRGKHDIRGCLTTELYKVSLCPTGRDYVKISQISRHARTAIISAEDTTFFQHQGFDWHELKQSFDKNLDSGKFARGGSTITQQLAKNVYLSAEKSILRKIREALITRELEKLLSKEQILEKYLNVVEFAPLTYGIKAASWYYFTKPPSSLNIAESAWLAFVLPNPKKYSESFKKKTLTKFASKQIRNIVQRMGRLRYLKPEEVQRGLSEAQTLFGYAEHNREKDLDEGSDRYTDEIIQIPNADPAETIDQWTEVPDDTLDQNMEKPEIHETDMESTLDFEENK